MIMKLLQGIGLGVALLALSSCNPVKSTAAADAEVVKFHALYDAQDFETIYLTSAPEFQSSQPKDKSIEFMKAVRDRLGPVKSSSRTGISVNSYNLRTSVTLTYHTLYEHGDGVETFVYFVKDDTAATLVKWHINSNSLILGGPSAAPAVPPVTSAPSGEQPTPPATAPPETMPSP